MTAVDSKAELAPNLLTSHHTHVSPHTLQMFIRIYLQDRDDGSVVLHVCLRVPQHPRL
jgi:hypothetical protein